MPPTLLKKKSWLCPCGNVQVKSYQRGQYNSSFCFSKCAWSKINGMSPGPPLVGHVPPTTTHSIFHIRFLHILNATLFSVISLLYTGPPLEVDSNPDSDHVLQVD